MSDTIAAVRKRIEKKYKDRADTLFPDLTKALDIEAIPTPSAIINAICGVGGFPRGRITEIYGPESTGKTTMAIEAAVMAQRSDPNACVLFIDYEHAFCHPYAAALGLDLSPDRFIFTQPDYFEQGMAILKEFLEAGLIDMAVIDSVAAMIPLSQYEGDVDPNANKTGAKAKTNMGRVGLLAQLLSQNLGWLTKRISSGRKPALIAINQMRTKMNLRHGVAYDDSTGGNALKFYSTIRLQLGRARGEGGDASSEVIETTADQARVTIECVKNKVAPPWRKGAFVIKPGQGIDYVESVADLADMLLGLKVSSNGQRKYQGDTPETSFSVRGRPALVELLQDNAALTKELEAKSLAILHKNDLTTTQHPSSDIESPDVIVLKDDDVDEKSSVGEAEGTPDIDLGATEKES